MTADELPFCVRKLTKLKTEIDTKEADLEEIFQSIEKNEERLSYLLDLQIKANEAGVKSLYIHNSLNEIETNLLKHRTEVETLRKIIKVLGEKFDKVKTEVDGLGWHNSLFHGWIKTEVKED